MAINESYDSTTIREDLSDLIANISPVDTPMLSAARTTSASSTNHMWVEDTLAATNSANAAEEGLDASEAEFTTGTKLSNYTQISQKAFGVSGTMEAANSAGFDSALAYASAKAAKELKNDVDAVITKSNQTKLVGASGQAPKTASIDCWIRNRTIGGGSGADPSAFDGTAKGTDGTQREFTQTVLDDTIDECWTNGGSPKLIITGPVNRKLFSTFDGLGNAIDASTMRTDRAAKTIIGTADVYMSNFGDLNVVTSRNIRQGSSKDRDAFLIDPEYLKVAYLRPWQETELAKTGDADKRQMLVEYALVVSNTYAHGLCADLGG